MVATKKELLQKIFVLNVFTNEIIEILEKSPYNDGLIIPTKNSVFVREKDRESYSFHRGCFIDYRKLLTSNFKFLD